MSLPARIEVDGALGGQVMICYIDEREAVVTRISAARLDDDGSEVIEHSAAFAAEQCATAFMAGHDVALQVFDGDNGERVFAIPYLHAPRTEWLFYP